MPIFMTVITQVQSVQRERETKLARPMAQGGLSVTLMPELPLRSNTPIMLAQ